MELARLGVWFSTDRLPVASPFARVLQNRARIQARALGAIATAALLLGCGSVEPITDCRSERGISPICGLHNPEDLALLPDGRLIISQMSALGDPQPGSVARLDPDTGRLVSLFPRGGAGAEPEPAALAPGWGASDCPGPPGAEFSPHGIDLAARPDGALQLLVVNHGGRESIELFEVASRPGGFELEWRGCAVPGDPHLLNDVAALPDGGFVTTHMLPRSGRLGGLYHGLRGMLGFDTGYVLEWSEAEGFRELEGSSGAMPNGIAVSRDGRHVFVNLYAGGELRRIARDGSEPPLAIEVAAPDNLTWTPDGRLLVASHRGTLREMLGCGGIETGACPMAFAILSVDPDSLTAEVVFENAGPPMGAGTAAVQRGEELFIGSFAGDRLIRSAVAR